MRIERILEEKGVVIPELPPLAGTYKRITHVGTLVFVSGQGPIVDGHVAVEGRLGETVTIEEGQHAARLCVLNALSVLKSHLGDLDRIKQFVKILGFVSSAQGFTEQPRVIDGASLLLEELFGEEGIAARSAIGTHQLPGDIPVEIEFIVEIFGND
jgi:enamine deaminase RidA (YjgF/YER057c/UK114 family)